MKIFQYSRLCIYKSGEQFIGNVNLFVCKEKCNINLEIYKNTNVESLDLQLYNNSNRQQSFMLIKNGKLNFIK